MLRIVRPALALFAALAASGTAQGQTQNYFGTTGTLSGSVWSTNPAGPYTDPLNTTGGAVINFGNPATFTGASITVAGINATANAIGAAGGTISNQGNGVITVNIATGATLDFGTQSFTSSVTAGYIKTGDGVLALAGNTYGGGFTLNAGTVIVRGVNALGGAAANTLTLNGGIIASNASRDLTGKYGGGITVGGNVQFGDVTGLASSSANLTFTNNVALGNAARTLTLGNAGTQTLGGVISNSVAAGSDAITFAATAGGTGRFEVTNTANTFTGNIRITGGEVRFTADGSLGDVNNSITIDGGRLATLNAATYTLSATRNIFVGDTVGTSISTPGTGTLTYNGVIANVAGKTGSWAKQGGGTLVLGGANTYTGATAINNGTLRLAADNRLPTGTTVSLGQAASGNLGTLDLNGFVQTIAGLNSTTGTNATATKNTVTSTNAATLTLGGSGTYSYGDGTAANSGVITGAISLVKSGTGTQILGDTNTYTGSTTVNAGVLRVNTFASLGGSGRSVQVNANGTLAAGFALDQATLNRVATSSAGVVALAADSGNALSFSGFTANLSLGAVGGTTATPVVLSGPLTPNGTNYRLGGGGGVLQVSSALADTTGPTSLNVGRNGTAAGTVILSAANTYTGGTAVQAGTLLVTTVGPGSGTGTGAVTVSNTATLGGTGRVEGPVTVNIGGTIRGGYASADNDIARGTLSTGNVTLVGSGTGAVGATLAVDLNGNATPGTTLGQNGYLTVGTNVFNIDNSNGGADNGKVNIKLLNDFNLSADTPYTLTLVSGSAGNFRRNGTAVTAYSLSDFNLLSDFWAFTLAADALKVDPLDNNHLILTFQLSPVPEPATVLAVGAAGLGLATWVRRRRQPAVPA